MQTLKLETVSAATPKSETAAAQSDNDASIDTNATTTNGPNASATATQNTNAAQRAPQSGAASPKTNGHLSLNQVMQQIAALNGETAPSFTGTVLSNSTWTSTGSVATTPATPGHTQSNAQSQANPSLTVPVPSPDVATASPDQTMALPIDIAAPVVAPADSQSAETGTGADSNSHTSDFGKDKISASPATSILPAVSASVPTFAQTISLAAAPVSPNAAGSSSTHGSSNDAVTSGPSLLQGTSDTPELSAALQAWNGGDNAQTRLVQSAHLGSHQENAEMTIALQAGKLGAVEVHARVSGDQVGASIALERHEAHTALSSDLSSLHQALNDRQLRVQDITLHHGSLSSGSAGNENSAPQQQRDAAPQRPAQAPWSTTAIPSSQLAEISRSSESDAGTIFDSSGRLSVRA